MDEILRRLENLYADLAQCHEMISYIERSSQPYMHAQTVRRSYEAIELSIGTTLILLRAEMVEPGSVNRIMGDMKAEQMLLESLRAIIDNAQDPSGE